MKKISSQKLQLKRVAIASMSTAAGGRAVDPDSGNSDDFLCTSMSEPGNFRITRDLNGNPCGGESCGCYTKTPDCGQIEVLVGVTPDDK